MTELALKLIAKNKKSRSPFLDLGNCGLTRVPPEISELYWLEELSFANAWANFDSKKWITQVFHQSDSQNNIACLEPSSYWTLKPFTGSSAKTTSFPSETKSEENGSNEGWDVSFAYNDISPLSSLRNLRRINLSNTPVIDLAPLSGLVKLQRINIWNTPVTDLSPLTGLTNLQRLNVWNTKVSDLSPLSGLTNLERLNVWNTPVMDLSPLSNLVKLEELNISKTRVEDLSPLSNLTSLLRLNVSKTHTTDLSPVLHLIKANLPVRWRPMVVFNDGIYVENCPLTSPPIEIIEQGNDAIINFFEEKAIQGTDQLYEAKMLIIGEGGSGKTSLLRRLYQPQMPLPDENETTKGIAIHRHEFKRDNENYFRLNVWDFGGQEIYHATHQFFLTKRSLYVLLDDTRKDDKTVHDAGFKYWLEVAELLGDHSPILIFQNEKGGRSKTIDDTGIMTKFSNVKGIYRGNLEEPDSVDDFRKDLEFYAQKLPHIGEKLPAKWILIRSNIEQRAKVDPFISLQDYFDIYKKHLDFDRDKALHLSRYLHDLGVFLHFQDEPLLSRTVILQNTWATEAVFKILDDEIVKKNLGLFDSTDYKRIWQDSIYADMHPELLALMQKFELCYRLPDKQTEAWLAPQLLPPSKPEELYNWEQPGDLTLRYRYEFLPKGIISRLIVRMHRFISRHELSWISGAVFENAGTEVLVEVPAKGGKIVLRARGPERKEMLSVISADIDALNNNFHGLKNLVGKWVPCLCSRCRGLSDPEFFDQRRLLQRKVDGKLKIECPASYENVSVLELLDGIRAD